MLWERTRWTISRRRKRLVRRLLLNLERIFSYIFHCAAMRRVLYVFSAATGDIQRRRRSSSSYALVVSFRVSDKSSQLCRWGICIKLALNIQWTSQPNAWKRYARKNVWVLYIDMCCFNLKRFDRGLTFLSFFGDKWLWPFTISYALNGDWNWYETFRLLFLRLGSHQKSLTTRFDVANSIAARQQQRQRSPYKVTFYIYSECWSIIRWKDFFSKLLRVVLHNARAKKRWDAHCYKILRQETTFTHENFLWTKTFPCKIKVFWGAILHQRFLCCERKLKIPFESWKKL